MGEEYGEEHPFHFFCSFSDPKLIEDVRSGRRREFEAFHANGGDVPDPQAKTTFAASRLTWSWESDQHKSGLRRLYQDLLRTRHEWPALRDYSQRSARMRPETQSGVILELVRGGAASGRRWDDTSLLQSHRSTADYPFRDLATVLWTSEAKRYHGGRRADMAKERLLPYKCMVFGSTRES